VPNGFIMATTHFPARAGNRVAFLTFAMNEGCAGARFSDITISQDQRARVFPLRIEDVAGGDDDVVWGREGRYLGLRTRVFDDYLAAAAAASVRQFGSRFASSTVSARSPLRECTG
jgi:hypothetical protein